MTDLVVIDASVLLAIPLPDPKPNKDYATALLYAIDKGDVVDVRDFEALFADALTMGCGSYDASYLRAALDNGALLATLDKKLLPHLAKNGVQQCDWQPCSGRHRRQPRHRSVHDCLSVSSHRLPSSPPPGLWFYWGDNYSDAGGRSFVLSLVEDRLHFF